MSKNFLNPSETSSAVINMGIARGNENFLKILIGGFLAGMFIGLAGIGQITVTQTLSQNFDAGFSKFMGACIFPVGLMLCVFSGSSLFTGNSLLTLSVLTKDISFYKLVRNISIVWIGNFLGGIFTACVSYFSGIFNSQVMQNAVISSAVGKINLSFSEAFFSGFLCNVLVAVGVVMAMSATDAAGKLFACWFPIMLFVVSGYQHIVANMYILSLAKILSPDSVPFAFTFINHIIPVTLGNFASGGIFLPIIIYFLYVKNTKKN